jgi:lysophospholipase L1-like esterase
MCLSPTLPRIHAMLLRIAICLSIFVSSTATILAAAPAAPTKEQPALVRQGKGTLVLDAAPKSPLAKLDLKDGDSIVFLGDSITQQCLYPQYVEDYYFTRFPKMRLKFHNSGVGGDRASDALARFDRDVAAYKPKYVTVLLGMNDGSYKAYDEATFQTYRDGMRQLIDKIVALDATPILITPTMYDSRSARNKKPMPPFSVLEFYNGVLGSYGSWLREVAVDDGYGFADMYSPLNNFTLAARKKDPTFTLIKDAVHPDPPGQVVMAFALLSDMSVMPRVSTITVGRTGDQGAQVQALGGKATDAHYTSDGVELNFQPDSLPLVLPAEAKVGVDLVHLGHRLGREALAVNGLEPGKYQLSINDQPVGVYSAQQLADTVELQNNDKTPEYQQGFKVSTLNAERTETAVRPLRNLWRTKKLLTRTQVMAQQAPDNAKLQANLKAYEQQLADFEGQITKLEAAAHDYEDRIYQAAQPQPLRIRVARLAASGQ